MTDHIDRTRRAILGTAAGAATVGIPGVSAASGGTGQEPDDPVWFSGHAHEPLGEASLENTGDELVVSNAEQTDDGVAVQLDGATRFGASTAGFSQMGPGQGVTLTGRGTVGGDSDAPVGRLAVEDTGDGLDVDPDFDPVDASTLRVGVYVDGMRVGDIEINHRSDLILRYRDYVTGWYYNYGVYGGSNSDSGPSIGVGFDDTAVLEVEGEENIEGDAFEFYVEEADEEVEDLSSFGIGTNVGSFAIEDEISK